MLLRLNNRFLTLGFLLDWIELLHSVVLRSLVLHVRSKKRLLRNLLLFRLCFFLRLLDNETMVAVLVGVKYTFIENLGFLQGVSTVQVFVGPGVIVVLDGVRAHHFERAVCGAHCFLNRGLETRVEVVGAGARISTAHVEQVLLTFVVVGEGASRKDAIV
jgi:hypothetical protein